MTKFTKQYQVTLYCSGGKYKPVSAIVNYQQINPNISALVDPESKAEIRARGIQKICAVRYWDKRDIKKYGYDRVNMRAYDPEKIAEKNAARYEAIKEAKYATGEWKRPKGENND